MTTNPRTVLGKKLDGNYGLRCSLPGVDALNGDSSLGGFSFDDEWTDIVKVALVGTASVLGGSRTPPGVTTTVTHGLGFVPFVEARKVSGSTIFDDYFNLTPGPFSGTNSTAVSNRFSGAPCQVTSSSILFIPQASANLSGGVVPYVAYSAIYVVYQIAVPNPS